LSDKKPQIARYLQQGAKLVFIAILPFEYVFTRFFAVGMIQAQSTKIMLSNSIYTEIKISMNLGSFSYMNSYLAQESIALMFVALGLAIIGIGYARLKTPESLKLHRWMMSGAVILSLTSIFLVMFLSLYFCYVIQVTALLRFSQFYK